MLAWSEFALATYSNAEVIAINQEPGGSAAVRIAGDDLTLPAAGSPNPCPIGRFDNCTNVWGRLLTTGAELAIAFVNNGPASVEVHCAAACFHRIPQRGGHVLPANASFRVRKLWSHAWLPGNVGLDLAATAEARGGSRMFRLVPAAD